MSEESLKAKARRLSFNQKLTLIFAAVSLLSSLASLGVAVVAVMLAANTKDIKHAISNLSELAIQTKRQADNTTGQLEALRQQVGEAKAQTKAISQQTDAIKNTSTASIKAATAQQRMADVTAKANAPDVDLVELKVNALDEPADATGMVSVTLFWRFKNTGGSAFTARRVMYGLQLGDALPDKMPEGSYIDGNGLVITPEITSAFALAEPLKLAIPAKLAADLKDHRARLFFFARFEYEDKLGTPHAKCFGRELIVRGGGASYAIPSGGPAYRCNN